MTREELIKYWDVIQAFKEGKQIQFKDFITHTWKDTTDPKFQLEVEYRVKPESTKRTPTIEEVEQWFLDNKVFINKNGILIRIESLNKKDKEVYFDSWYNINEFCKQFTHYDGSELYITE